MRLVVPVYQGAVEPPAQVSDECRRLHNWEIQTARSGKRNQSLSIRLAAIYHRNVYSAGGLQYGTWMEAMQSQVGPIHEGVPSREFLLGGDYHGIAVAFDLAEMLILRDGDSDLAFHEKEAMEAFLAEDDIQAFLRGSASPVEEAT